MSAPAVASPRAARRSTEAKRTRHAEQQDTPTVAYELWQQRGSPFGSPDIDWFQAEQKVRELQALASSQGL
jgi:hypothetical protein